MENIFSPAGGGDELEDGTIPEQAAVGSGTVKVAGGIECDTTEGICPVRSPGEIVTDRFAPASIGLSQFKYRASIFTTTLTSCPVKIASVVHRQIAGWESSVTGVSLEPMEMVSIQ